MNKSDSAPALVRIEHADGVSRVVLDSAETRNALSLDLSRQLRDALVEATSDPRTRVVVLSAKGPLFSVGGELLAFRAAPVGANLNEVVARPLHDAIEAMTTARQPVVCVLHGSVGGGGVGLVLAADIVVMADSAAIRMGYTGSGLSPDCGVTWFLPRLLGVARAMDLLLTNRRVEAAEALQLGLVSRVVAADSLDSAVQDVLGALARVPVDTLGETKRLVRRAPVLDLHTQLDDEARTIGRIGDTADAREAMAAFLDKRPAIFSR